MQDPLPIQTLGAHEGPKVVPGRVRPAALSDHADRERVPLGEHPRVRAGQRAPVEMDPLGPLLAQVPRVELDLEPEVDAGQPDADVPGHPARRAVRRDDVVGPDLALVVRRSTCLRPVDDLGDPARSPHLRAGLHRAVQQPLVELAARGHREERRPRGPLPVLAPDQGERRPRDGHPHRRAGGQGARARSDQSTPTGLVAGERRPVEEHDACAGGRGGAGGRAPCRARPHDGDVVVLHPPNVSARSRPHCRPAIVTLVVLFTSFSWIVRRIYGCGSFYCWRSSGSGAARGRKPGHGVRGHLDDARAGGRLQPRLGVGGGPPGRARHHGGLGLRHWRFGNVCWRTVRRLAIPGAIGAFCGAVLLSNISSEIAKPWMAASCSRSASSCSSASPCAGRARPRAAATCAAASSPRSAWAPGSSTRPAAAAGAPWPPPPCSPRAGWSRARWSARSTPASSWSPWPPASAS